MKWSFLSGGVAWETYGGKLVTGPFDNGDFRYWLVLDILNWEESVGTQEAAEIDGTHNVSLCVVAPSECPATELQSAFESCGWEDMEVDNSLVLVELLHSYGIFATVWSKTGSLKDLLRRGKNKAEETELLFGFAMDRFQNGMGATGWDFIRGDTIGHPVHR